MRLFQPDAAPLRSATQWRRAARRLRCSVNLCDAKPAGGLGLKVQIIYFDLIKKETSIHLLRRTPTPLDIYVSLPWDRGIEFSTACGTQMKTVEMPFSNKLPLTVPK